MDVVVPRVNMLTTDDPILHIMARVKYLQKDAKLRHLNDIIVPNKYSNSTTGTSGAHYHKRFYNYHKRDYRFGHTIDVRIIPYSEFGARDKPYTYYVHDLGWDHIDYFTPPEDHSPEYNDGFYMGFFIVGMENNSLLTISADNLDTYNYLRSLWKSIDF